MGSLSGFLVIRLFDPLALVECEILIVNFTLRGLFSSLTQGAVVEKLFNNPCLPSKPCHEYFMQDILRTDLWIQGTVFLVQSRNIFQRRQREVQLHRIQKDPNSLRLGNARLVEFKNFAIQLTSGNSKLAPKSNRNQFFWTCYLPPITS